MRLVTGIETALRGQRGHLFPWVPVCLATGIGAFFLLPEDPTGLQLVTCGVVAVVAVLMAALVREGFAPAFFAVTFVCLGVILAAFRTYSVAEPVLKFRYYGAVEGTIVGMDRSASDKLRLTLSDVVMERMGSDRTPKLLRVSLHGEQGYFTPRAGLRVIMTAHVSPPSGPTEPGGFDFQRHAWFRGIGGVGYTRVPVLAIAPPDPGPSLFGIRMSLSDGIRAHLGGEVGGFAAAVSTGDRSAIPKPTIEALRASNLAHLLAISGLHLGLLAGFVFAVMRFGIALIPPLALRIPAKKVAAAVALVASAGYLALSGGNVATQRAFVMAAVALVAVMLDRRALSLRAVAMAAVIVMILRPEAVLGPGFQMSFAATTALVAVFGLVRDHKGFGLPRWLSPVLAVFVSSLVAGLATAPIAAAHFNVVSHYGLPANLLAVPVMGLIVVPSAVLALVLAPFGFEAIGLWIMGLGLEWILGVAHFFASRPGARGFVPGPPTVVIPLFALGMLWLILWQSRLRVAGIVLVGLAAALWVRAERPAMLVSDTGGLVGIMGPEGRILSKEKGQGFVALNWLENDGDPADQVRAALRGEGDKRGLFQQKFGVHTVYHVQGKAGLRGFDGCKVGDIVVFTHQPPVADWPCLILTPKSLRQSGSVSLQLTGKGLKMTTARDKGGLRLWSGYGELRP